MKGKENDSSLLTLEARVNPLKAAPYAIQQVLAMFVSNIVPLAMIVAAAKPSLSAEMALTLTQNAMIVAGIATFIQATPIWKIGSGLPIFMGVSFTFMVALSSIATKYGYGAVAGAVLIGGAFEGLLGLTAKYWKKMIAPIVSATVVTGIGISLVGSATRSFGGGYSPDFGSFSNLIIGTVTIVGSILWQVFVKGHRKQLSILIGIAAGYITALAFGKVVFSDLLRDGWFSLPRILPVKPIFKIDAIISICIVYLVSATETIGDTTALAGGALGRDATPEEVSGALAIDGFGSAIGGLFGVSPVTSYSQNVGITIMTKVVNRNVARVGAVILFLCGFFPPIGAFFHSIPEPVIGGMLLIATGQIIVSGFQMVFEAGFTTRNKLIASLSLAIGIGFSTSTEIGIWEHFPVSVQTIFGQNVVTIIFVFALLLNLVLPKDMD